MDFKEALESLELKFTSANDVEVERTSILREEWEALRTGFCKCGTKKKSVDIPEQN